MGCALGHEPVCLLNAGPNCVNEGMPSISSLSDTPPLTNFPLCHDAQMSFKIRQKSMVRTLGIPSTIMPDTVFLLLQKWTDGRSKLLQELLQSMAIIKQFCYETPFLKRELSEYAGILSLHC